MVACLKGTLQRRVRTVTVWSYLFCLSPGVYNLYMIPSTAFAL